MAFADTELDDVGLDDPERRRLLGMALTGSAAPPVSPLGAGPIPPDEPPAIRQPASVPARTMAAPSEPPPIRQPGPAGMREQALLQQGPPQYHGWKRALDVLGRATVPGRAIEEGTGLGTLGYQSRLGQAAAASKEEQAQAKAPADVEFEQARTEEQKARATQEKAKAEATLHPPPKPPKEESWKVVPGVVGPSGKVLQEEQNSGQVRWAPDISGVGPLKPPTTTRQPIRVMGDRTFERTETGDWKDIGPAPPRSEPGNYSPVNDENGGTVGWVNPKTGHMVHVGEISGMTEQVAPGGAIPPKPGQMQQGRAAQAAVIDRAGTNLIDTLTTHKAKVGNVEAFLKSIFLNTPIADPELAGVATELGSFAALQPAMHGFRGTDALREFEKLIGGVPKDVDALISSIKAIQRTAGAVNPRLAADPPRPPGVPEGAKFNHETRRWQMPTPKQ